MYLVNISGTKKRISESFFLLKTEIQMQFLNTEPFLCDIRGLRYLQNKIGFRNNQAHIHTDQKWYSLYQKDFETIQLTFVRPGHTLKSYKGPDSAQTGLSGMA